MPHIERDASEGLSAPISANGEPLDLEGDGGPVRRRARRHAPTSSTCRPTISAASSRGRRSGRSTVAIDRPPRSTVIRSATALTSCSLCEMKITVLPSAAIARSV